MTNYKFVVAYQGTRYHGFQKQIKEETVESVLCDGLAQAFGQDIRLNAAGRTDAGVHAEGQVFNCFLETSVPVDKMVVVANQNLPNDIRIRSVAAVADSFRARSAKRREYRYLFSTAPLPLYLREFVTEYPYAIDETAIEGVSDLVKGEHDFRNFRKTGSLETHTNRVIYQFKIGFRNMKDLYGSNIRLGSVMICGNSFLYNMVRNIVGAIFEILKGKQTLDKFKSLLDRSIDRVRYYYATAPAHGLSLVKVTY